MIQVQKFRYAHPEISLLKSFLLVIKAGGEVPDEENDPEALKLQVCCLCAPSNSSRTQQGSPSLSLEESNMVTVRHSVDT